VDYIKYLQLLKDKRAGKLADEELRDLEQVADKDAAWSAEFDMELDKLLGEIE